jgi:hypothetical protein
VIGSLAGLAEITSEAFGKGGGNGSTPPAGRTPRGQQPGPWTGGPSSQ